MHCTRYALYSLCTVIAMHCTRYAECRRGILHCTMLMTLYTIHCTLSHTLHTVHYAHTLYTILIHYILYTISYTTRSVGTLSHTLLAIHSDYTPHRCSVGGIIQCTMLMTLYTIHCTLSHTLHTVHYAHTLYTILIHYIHYILHTISYTTYCTLSHTPHRCSVAGDTHCEKTKRRVPQQVAPWTLETQQLGQQDLLR
jgi:hypothetical protein